MTQVHARQDPAWCSIPCPRYVVRDPKGKAMWDEHNRKGRSVPWELGSHSVIKVSQRAPSHPPSQVHVIQILWRPTQQHRESKDGGPPRQCEEPC